MLNINNRRIPMEEEFMKDKMISDLLYSMLQSYSNWNKEENHRYIPKKIIKKSKWAKALGISRPTLDKRIGKLLEKEYLIDKEDYYILPNKGEYYFLVPVETLNYLINTANHNVIKIYCHLGLLYKFYGDKAYYTQSKLLEVIGYDKTDKNNHKTIKHILTSLKLNGLLVSTSENEGIITKERILAVNSTIRKPEQIS
jgi:biotin operon repressor